MRAVCPWVPVERGLAHYIMRHAHLGKITDLGFAPDPAEPLCAPGYVCKSPGGSSILGSFFPNYRLPTFSLAEKSSASQGTKRGKAELLFQTLPAKGGPPKCAASRRPWESRLCSAACTELVKPPKPNFPWLNLLEPALALCQASLRWHRLLFNEKNKGTFPGILLSWYQNEAAQRTDCSQLRISLCLHQA